MADNSDEVTLKVNGKLYEGWMGAQVKRSIKAIAGSFELSVTDDWTDQGLPWAIRPGDECQLLIGNEPMITGYVDQVSPSMEPGSRTVSVTGRDKTGDMVDCSVEHKPGQLTDISLLRLAQILAKPFGVSVRADTDVGSTFVTWRMQNGESAYEALERAARLHGVLITNDGKGSLVLTHAGKNFAATDLVQGVNILKASATFDNKERFSSYTVKMQGANYEDDDPSVDFSLSGHATDPGVTRHRPLVIMAESLAGGTAGPKKRALWEANVRAAKGVKISVSTNGWRQHNGALWQINELVRVAAPWLGIDQELLISGLVFIKSDSAGTVTQFELERPDAYAIDPTLSDKKDIMRQLVIADAKK